MKFNHLVKFGGVYYEAGEEVPMGEVVEESTASSEVLEEAVQAEPSHKYTESDLNVPYNQLRTMCKENGINIAKNSKADELKRLLLEL